ncbi:hypothetical protein [Helicobacter zhangjianzhongii]|uniref:Uncharacterized protein n=1 Tax=Helicobacter zhangjianzhongii TaxID=2974574 RepID=A0ACC6FUU4_9HELI|nr:MULTISPECIES: hypothetical protein [unclassified Helicobacter]MDL0080996.1 hypothetical protein [Helicobacter sp. CPD2-1]MDL0083064.1 hypothetical protein [Helicobacter sp. XJK30-2]
MDSSKGYFANAKLWIAAQSLPRLLAMTILVEFVCWDCVLFVDSCFRILGFSKKHRFACSATLVLQQGLQRHFSPTAQNDKRSVAL